MFPKKSFSTKVGGKTLTIEFSPIAEQANAAVLAKYGETAVLVSVVMSPKDENVNYLPLRVDYEERFYAAGKIIGSRFIRREGRPSEDAVLSGRLVDRVIRPLFDHRIRRSIQVVVTVLAYDEENDPDFVGLIGASAALAISDVPWNGPVAGVRMAKIDGELVVNPSAAELQKPRCLFETFVAGPEGIINMIEFGGKEARESEVLEAMSRAQKEIDALISFERSVVAAVGKPKAQVVLAEPDPALVAAVASFIAPRLEAAVFEKEKQIQHRRMDELKEALCAHLVEQFEEPDLKTAELLFGEAVDALIHKKALEEEKRPDGRRLDEMRELSAEVGLFERTHGSALFVRGQTQAFAATTLAPPGAEQLIETMEITGKRRFMLHYNFPPYSVGEIGPFRSPGRREIGHGALAEKALRPLIPSPEEFPYTIRVVSEILSSNGSSSMATVCAGTLSLMDAGVPIRRPAAGIAMGLMIAKEKAGGEKERKYKILTDIQGPEDYYGDMDFKVAGTEEGLTAIQLDVKCEGLTIQMIEKTLAQAKKARLEILSFIKTVLPAPRPSLSKYVPTVVQLAINPEKIGLVIGPGGRTINGMIREYGLVGIDVDDAGRVSVSGYDGDKVRKVAEQIKNLTREIAVGEVVEGPVVKILDFGAIVDLGGGMDGMIHVSELKEGYVKNVSDVVKVGDFVRARVIRVEEGKIGLSLKQL